MSAPEHPEKPDPLLKTSYVRSLPSTALRVRLAMVGAFSDSSLIPITGRLASTASAPRRNAATRKLSITTSFPSQ